MIIMGRGKAAYIFKVDSALNGARLKEAITSCIVSHKIIETGTKKGRKGFKNINIPTEDTHTQIPEVYYRDNNQSSIRAVYQEYREEKDKYSQDIQYIPDYLDILYDYQKRNLIIFTSNLLELKKILALLNFDPREIDFKPPNYSNSTNVEPFFRWLITTSKSNPEKFPPSCKLLNIEGTRVIHLEQSTRHSTSDTARLKSVGHLADDHLYEQVEDEGIRDYINCIFHHSRFAINTTIYNNGKINLASRPPKITDHQYFSLFPIIFEEMENLYNAFTDDQGGDQ